MESIIRSVRDIEGEKRSTLESVIGRKLQDNQQLIIRVISVDTPSSDAARDSALDEASRLAEQGRRHAASLGVTVEEADNVINESIQDVRHQPS